MSMMMFLKQLGALLKPKCMRSEESDVSASNQIRVLKFSFTEIRRATNNFSSERVIRLDGVGPVYMGILLSGEIVTVKRLDPKLGSDRRGFKTEISVLSHIRHPHIVSLIGYCDKRKEMILVYEYAGKRNLRDRLYIENSEGYSVRSTLSWEQRLQICIDSAEAIHYLHSGLGERVIHLDVKSSKILVDENLRAKLTFDLGYSSPFDTENYSTEMPGSIVYVDPEYVRTLQFTEKSDVYSFGVVLLEVLCARPALPLNASPWESMNLAKWGMLWHRQGELERIIDPVLVGNINSNSFKKYCETIELCLRENRDKRPGMREVIWNLEMALESQLC